MTNPADNHGPLRGVRVLDAGTVIAAPLTCKILGDFGADVIKVEHPQGGDPIRGHGYRRDGVEIWWKSLGRNKRSVGIDLSDERGAAVFRALAATADVVVENFRPGTMERWGLGYDILAERNPGLIMLRTSGFGQTGPYRNRQAFGTLIEAMSGFAEMTGEPQGPPTLPVLGLADSISGIAGVGAVCMALYEREQDEQHRGQVIDLSILEPMVAAVGPGPLYYDQLGIVGKRSGNRSAMNAPRNAYRTRDGGWVVVSASTTPVAARVMKLVGHPEVAEHDWFATARGRAEHVELIDELVAAWIATRDRDEVVRAFEAAGAAAAPIYNAESLMNDPHVIARDVFVKVDDPELGTMRMQNVLYRFSRTAGGIRHTGRRLGADTDDLLIRELGLPPEEVARLRDEGVLA